MKEITEVTEKLLEGLDTKPRKRKADIVPEAKPRLKPRPEAKTERLQLLIRPTTGAGLKKLSKKTGLSKNEIVNRILEGFLDTQESE